MLEELIAALPGIHPFEDNILLDERMETAMVDLYTELVLFCVRAISFVRVRRQHCTYLLAPTLAGLRLSLAMKLKNIPVQCFRFSSHGRSLVMIFNKVSSGFRCYHNRWSGRLNAQLLQRP